MMRKTMPPKGISMTQLEEAAVIKVSGLSSFPLTTFTRLTTHRLIHVGAGRGLNLYRADQFPQVTHWREMAVIPPREGGRE